MESTFNLDEIHWFMQEAFQEATKAQDLGEVPVGAVIVTEHKEILAKAYNLKETDKNPCGHAEVLSIIEAAKQFGDWRLCGASMFVTLEPCLMCMGAIVHARLKSLYFGAYDKKAGAVSLGFGIHNDKRLNHKFNVYGGLNHFENSKQISDFFRARRTTYR